MGKPVHVEHFGRTRVLRLKYHWFDWLAVWWLRERRHSTAGATVGSVKILLFYFFSTAQKRPPSCQSCSLQRDPVTAAVSQSQQVTVLALQHLLRVSVVGISEWRPMASGFQISYVCIRGLGCCLQP
jgi:hypothetical protein